MSNSNNSDVTTDASKNPVGSQDPAGSAAESYQQPKDTGCADLLSQLKDIYQAGHQWLFSLIQLGSTELERNIAIITRMLLLRIYLIPMTMICYASTCVAIGWITYDMTNSAAWSIALLLGFQLLAIAGVVFSVKILRKHLGFKHTKNEIEAMYHELNNAFKSSTENIGSDSPRQQSAVH